MDHSRNLARLIAELDSIGDSPSIDDQARLVLLHVLRLGPFGLKASDFGFGCCPNCGALSASTRSPYCSTWCREAAGMVRQFRSNLESGQVFDFEKQAVYGHIIWWLVGGGYPRRVAMINESSKKQALRRVNGLCACGAQATAFDHIATACNRSINLRPVCASCVRTRAFLDPALLAKQDVLEGLASRMVSELPLRLCDDHANWDWRAFLRSGN